MSESAFWRGKRVLVTGHTGFKGSWLTLWLSRLGADVVGLALDPVGRSLFVDADAARDCASHVVDLRDAAATRAAVREARADVVFHLAAQPLVRASYAAATDTWAVNVTGTIHLLDALRDVPSTAAIVVVTSDKCYEQTGAGGDRPRPFVETDLLGGHDPYSASKAAAEVATASWRRSFFDARGVGVATVRAGNVIGGGDWSADRLVPDLVRSCVTREAVAIRSPRARRPWQHVLEPLRGYLMLAERLAVEPERFGGAWNFGPAEAASMEVAALAEHFRDAMGAWPSFDIVEDATLHEAATLALSSEKARRELGWVPALTIGDAIDLTAAAYLAALRGADQRAVVLAQIDAYARGTADRPRAGVAAADGADRSTTPARASAVLAS